MSASGAHPRSRGENRLSVLIRARSLGSSPLTRGKLFISRFRLVVCGLIPAHAGKTGFARFPLAVGGAHPRSRGENQTTAIIVAICGGSSPLTRGKPQKPTQPRTQTRAHPRSRGENRSAPRRPPTRLGSSPLTRGKLWVLWAAARPKGLIPAHAGKTHQPRARNSRPRAHPRSRGENISSRDRGTSSKGSSPLTRGKHGRWWSW